MDLRRSILNQTDNSFRLARRLFSKDSNLIFSPLLIHVSLGMTAAGSNAPIRDQIAGIVTSSSSDELAAFFSQIVSYVLADGGSNGGSVLSAANGLWVDLSLNLKPAFQDLLHHIYRAAIQPVDFQNKAKEVTKEVNEWCDKATKGLIRDIIPPGAVNPLLTRLIITNAVYFKGTWSQEFDPNLTRERDFHLMNGSPVRAPMMTNYIFYHQYFRSFDGFKVLKLPYIAGRDSRIFSMYIYLPDSIDGLPSLRERVCSQSGFIDSHLPYNKEQLDKFWVPKFKISFGFEASDLLNKLGLELPFEGDSLMEMVESCPFPLQVTGVFHKVFIAVNEEGTEAAAATGFLRGGGRGPPPSGKEFVADHPFMFVIREDTTGVVLFIGQLLNPLVSSY